MEDYKERMLEEYEQLCKRYKKLDKFIKNKSDNNPENDEFSEIEILKTQRVHMYGYKMALFLRLVHAGVKTSEDILAELEL